MEYNIFKSIKTLLNLGKKQATILKLMEEKVKEHSFVLTVWDLKPHSLKNEAKNGTLVVSLLKGSSPPRFVYCTVPQCWGDYHFLSGA